MPNGTIQIGEEVINVPLGEMIRSIAMAVADAQFQLDKSSMTMAELLSGHRLLRDIDTGKLLDSELNEIEVDSEGAPQKEPHIMDSRVYFGYEYEDGKKIPQKVSMLELGFVPNFYQFVDTVIEIKLAFRVNKVKKSYVSEKQTSQGGATSEWSESTGQGGDMVMTTTPVDAAYASTYNYSADMACVFKTKLVPIPPPATLEERIRLIVAKERENAS